MRSSARTTESSYAPRQRWPRRRDPGRCPAARVVPPGSAQDLAGAAIAAEAHTTIPSSVLTIACAPDIVPPGYVALGPAVSFGPEGTSSDRPFLLTLPYKA